MRPRRLRSGATRECRLAKGENFVLTETSGDSPHVPGSTAPIHLACAFAQGPSRFATPIARGLRGRIPALPAAADARFIAWVKSEDSGLTQGETRALAALTDEGFECSPTGLSVCEIKWRQNKESW